ncbi:MAG: aminopeptidase N [Desulfamplus sp.]|nr:aminopeptidase N [Desulfamplus sp.]
MLNICYKIYVHLIISNDSLLIYFLHKTGKNSTIKRRFKTVDNKQTNKHKTKYLKDYSPPSYWIDKIDLQFDLNEQETIVTSTMKIRRNREVADENTPLIFDCKELELLSVIANDMVLCAGQYETGKDVETGKDIFKLPKVPEEFTLEIKNRLQPHQNTALEGLYKSGGKGEYKTGGTFCTQCEAEGFRRITCFPDRPDVMTHFSCIITADKAKYPVLLSNGNIVERGDIPQKGNLPNDFQSKYSTNSDNQNDQYSANRRHYAIWDDPFKKPCYLFALVAGDLALIEDHFTTCSGRKITLHIYVEHENKNQCAHAMQSLKKAMKWDEERFGREYDLDLYQIVAVNDFNMGAMENKGLNVFNSKFVLADIKTATDTDFMNIERVIAHEYFHNWTGNRITLKNWFQLSLKEGLTVFRDQEFSSDVNSRAVQRISDVRKLRTLQFAEDSGPMAHPVRPESYIEMNNFYTMTVYEKGSEVIRMLFEILGKELFRKGMDIYFERFDGQAVTTEDFVQAMEDAVNMRNALKIENSKGKYGLDKENPIDFSQFKLWYSQSGTPQITVKREYEKSKAAATLKKEDSETSCNLLLHISQHTKPDKNQSVKLPMLIPVKFGLIAPDGKEIENSSQILTLKELNQTFKFQNVPKGSLPSLFRGFSAPVVINTDLTHQELAFLMANDTDEFNRWDAAQQLYFMELDCIIIMLQKGAEPSVSDHLVTAFKKALSDSIAYSVLVDRALTAKAITLPDETEIGQKYDPVDVDAIHSARSFLEQYLAKACEGEFKEIIKICSKADPNDLSHAAMADRSLKNCALNYIATLDTDESQKMVVEHYNNARNMTDEIAALSILCSSSGKYDLKALKSDKANFKRFEKKDADMEDALLRFREKWKVSPLVMDKWFSVQAGSTRPDTLNRIKELVRYPEFSWKNPNRVRSVLSVLGSSNPVIFHKIDGEGYKFFAERVIELDRINSQIAARMVSAFNRWRKYDLLRQKMMKERLEQIVSMPNLSRDVYEIVSRALE